MEPILSPRPAIQPRHQPSPTAGPAWLHSPIELPLLMLLRQRLQQQLDTAAAWAVALPPAAAVVRDARGGASCSPVPLRPGRPAADPRAARAALRRMAEGRYGWCQRCGQPIGRDRLLAQPATSTCEGCATGRADDGAHSRAELDAEADGRADRQP